MVGQTDASRAFLGAVGFGPEECEAADPVMAERIQDVSLLQRSLSTVVLQW